MVCAHMCNPERKGMQQVRKDDVAHNTVGANFTTISVDPHFLTRPSMGFLFSLIYIWVHRLFVFFSQFNFIFPPVISKKKGGFTEKFAVQELSLLSLSFVLNQGLWFGMATAWPCVRVNHIKSEKKIKDAPARQENWLALN